MQAEGKTIMGKSVFKYALESAQQALQMPAGAVVLTVATQNGIACIWAEVDRNARPEVRTFVGVATGSDSVPMDGTYVGTAHGVFDHLDRPTLVFHIYETP